MNSAHGTAKKSAPGADHFIALIANAAAGRDWTQDEVLFCLRKRGTSLQRLARQHDYHPRSLHNICKRPWPRGESIVAKALGLTAQQVFPSRYDADGARRLGHRVKHSTGPAAGHVHEGRGG